MHVNIQTGSRQFGINCDRLIPTVAFFCHQSTYKFLTNHTIFEEEHVWCDAIFIVVQGSCDTCWVHGATRVKLSSDKSQTGSACSVKQT